MYFLKYLCDTPNVTYAMQECMGKIEFVAKMSTPHLFFDNSNTVSRSKIKAKCHHSLTKAHHNTLSYRLHRFLISIFFSFCAVRQTNRHNDTRTDATKAIPGPT